MTMNRSKPGLRRAPMALVLVIGALAPMAPAGVAAAADLKSRIVVSEATVRLGDLFADAGAAADIPVARAPAPGAVGQLSVEAIYNTTRAAGMTWQPPANLRYVSVSRAGTRLPEQKIRALVTAAVRKNRNTGDFRLNFSSRVDNIQLPAGASSERVRVSALAIDPQSLRLTATLALPAGDDGTRKLELRGRIVPVGYVPVLARNIAKGQTIGDDDVKWIALPRRQMNSNIIREIGQVVGQAARRPLRPDVLLRPTDLEVPALVGKGDLVAITYRIGNMVVSGSGRALERGADGEVIRLLNTASNRTIEARVVAPGMAEVLTPHRLASNTR